MRRFLVVAIACALAIGACLLALPARAELKAGAAGHARPSLLALRRLVEVVKKDLDAGGKTRVEVVAGSQPDNP